ncbi:hypothetical protein ERJ70_05435 [Sediminibacillus dalangtanensis]|uniref:Uncharacterized protein n=1 Tax=Sediminibacillus dalangtanensis TaxID=2729421 RepID=A0ABX7VTJ0_9BACI|nr:hypothetical protein [Sediminibacillus dalangtanensis]QTM98788.1 hypothetical protein ERJ70_05435 [Sediminibacillus dalangtanensis]
MADEHFKSNLNEISGNLIQMHVSDLFNRLNISRGNKRLRELSSNEKAQIKESVESLKSQAEAFLTDQQNKNNAFQPQTEEILKKLQQIQQKNKGPEA